MKDNASDTLIFWASCTVHEDDVDQRLLAGFDTREKADDYIAEEAEKALRRGCPVTFANGAKEWRETVPVIYTAEGLTGADVYEWHEDGNRVRCERVRFILERGAAAPERVVTGACWRSYESV